MSVHEFQYFSKKLHKPESLVMIIEQYPNGNIHLRKKTFYTNLRSSVKSPNWIIFNLGAFSSLSAINRIRDHCKTLYFSSGKI